MKLINPYGDLHRELATQPEELQLKLRKKLIWAYSWAIPSQEAIEAIAACGPIVELGAGNGYWAWLLTQAGADVVAYDHAPEQVPKWFDVRQGDAASAGAHPDRTLLLVWPPYNEPMACEALERYSGSTVIYVGEWQGRTADTEFHRRLEQEWRIIRTLTIPCWSGYSDKVFFTRRIDGFN